MESRIIQFQPRTKDKRVGLNGALTEVAGRLEEAVECIKSGDTSSGIEEVMALAAYLRRLSV